MDYREPPHSSPLPRSQPQHSSASPNIMISPASFSSAMPNPITSSLINPNPLPTMLAPATARFPFSSFVTQSHSPPTSPPPPPPLRPSDPLVIAPPYEGSSSASRPCGLSIDSQKKKRGRPRKYSPDGSTALGLGPTPPSSSAPADLSATTEEPPAKKSRGRPPGSGKKQLDALGVGGTCFTPHVILVKTGEDIAAKIMSFCEQGSRSVCILSAHGAVCNATLQQLATSVGTVYYEGRYEIISLTGSFNPSEDGGCRTGGMSITLAGTDGKMVGGSVSGMLVAASTIQIIVGSFIVDGKKKLSSNEKSGPSPAATPTGTQVLNFGASSVTPTSATSQGGSSRSSDEDDNSPLQRGPGPGNGAGTGTGPGTGTGAGLYSSVSQPIHSMQWNQLWQGQR